MMTVTPVGGPPAAPSPPGRTGTRAGADLFADQLGRASHQMAHPLGRAADRAGREPDDASRTSPHHAPDRSPHRSPHGPAHRTSHEAPEHSGQARRSGTDTGAQAEVVEEPAAPGTLPPAGVVPLGGTATPASPPLRPAEGSLPGGTDASSHAAVAVQQGGRPSWASAASSETPAGARQESLALRGTSTDPAGTSAGTFAGDATGPLVPSSGTGSSGTERPGTGSSAKGSPGTKARSGDAAAGGAAGAHAAGRGPAAGDAMRSPAAQDHAAPDQPARDQAARDQAAPEQAARGQASMPVTGQHLTTSRSSADLHRVTGAETVLVSDPASTTATAGTAAGAGPTATGTGTGAGDSVASPAMVARQVLPEVGRLVSRGDGTHRVTLKLNPEALGDVRVVLTVRQGEVHVRLAGNEAAQHALLNGAGELHRLLERAGATSSEVVVGDQATTSSGSGRTGQDDLGTRHGTGHPDAHGRGDTHHTNHRTAGTRDGETSARDGATRGPQPRLPAEPSVRVRPSGLDVTI